jgi:hypothetical protein
MVPPPLTPASAMTRTRFLIPDPEGQLIRVPGHGLRWTLVAVRHGQTLLVTPGKDKNNKFLKKDVQQKYDQKIIKDKLYEEITG